MKKLIVALVAMFLAFSANAQIGIVVGLTSSSSDIKAAAADIKNVNQYHAGIAYKIGIGNLLTIQPAIIYNMKGTKIGAIAGVQDVAVDYKTGYLEIPVQLQLGFGIGSIARVYGFAEPYVGYAITNTVSSMNGQNLQQTWENVRDRLDYGVGLGVGAEFLKHLQVSVKYFWDMGKVYKAYGADINIGNVTSTVAGSSAKGVAASVAFFF